MKKRPSTLGAILAEMGRITAADVEQALRYQREHGGYFGEALVALGLLSAEEVNFALADQYDLPFVHLRPENIDRTVAQLVPAEWTRQHRMIPVLRDGDAVTLLSAVPPAAFQVEAILRFTGASRVEPAISTPETVDQLIDAVHRSAALPGPTLGHWLRDAIGAGATTLGVSARGERVLGWRRVQGGGVVQRGACEEWLAELRHLVSPFPDLAEGGVHRWPAILTVGEDAWRVECGALGSRSGVEYVLHINAAVPCRSELADTAPELVAALAEHAGKPLTVRAGLAAGEAAPEVLEVLLPGLPAVLLNRPVRSLHISDRPVAVPDGNLVLRPSGALADLLASVDVLALDALTLDVVRLDPDELELARRAAPLIVFRDASSLSQRLRSELHVCLCSRPSPRWNLAA